MYVRLSHFLPYLRMGYCIARIRISCTFVPNVLTTEKSNISLDHYGTPLLAFSIFYNNPVHLFL